jgi:hypothetical protein
LQLDERADTGLAMHTIGSSTKILAFLAGAIGLVTSLRLPWYGASPAAVERSGVGAEVGAPAEDFFSGIWRWFSAGDGADGYASLQIVDQILPVVAALSVITCALLFVSGAESFARSAARLLGLVALVAAVVPFFDQPGNNTLVEPRHGLMLAIGSAVVMCVSAGQISQTKLRRAPAPTMTSLHDPSLRAPAKQS